MENGIPVARHMYAATFFLSAFLSFASPASKSDISDVDVFLVAGQSNAEGWEYETVQPLSPTVPSGAVLQWNNNAIADGNDPIGNAGYGSAWPAFGIQYYYSNRRTVLFVPAAVGGSCQTTRSALFAHGYTDSWDDTGAESYFHTSVASVRSAMNELTHRGYQPSFKGVLWDQGECDAAAISVGNSTEALYQDGLAKMIANYRTQFGSATPFYIFRTGTSAYLEEAAGYAQVRDAQENIAAADPNSPVVFRDASNFFVKGLLQSDGVHYLQAGYNEMGMQGAESVAQHQMTMRQPGRSRLSNTSSRQSRAD